MISQLSEQQLQELALYPESDGKPMAENTEQYRWIVTIKENLEILFSTEANVFIAADLFWYPVPRTEPGYVAPQAPDVMVVFGRPKGKRGTYRQWEEANLAPQVVFEILSPSNKTAQGKREMASKLTFYQTYGVEEYYVYDPDDRLLEGWQRQGEQLISIKTIGQWISPRLGIQFEWRSGQEPILRYPDGRPFLSSVDLAQQADLAQQRANLAQQQADLAQQRADLAQQQAEQERIQRELAQQRAEKLAAYLRSIGVNPDEIAPE